MSPAFLCTITSGLHCYRYTNIHCTNNQQEQSASCNQSHVIVNDISASNNNHCHTKALSLGSLLLCQRLGQSLDSHCQLTLQMCVLEQLSNFHQCQWLSARSLISAAITDAPQSIDITVSAIFTCILSLQNSCTHPWPIYPIKAKLEFVR